MWSSVFPSRSAARCSLRFFHALRYSMFEDIIKTVQSVFILYEQQPWTAVVAVAFVLLWIGNLTSRTNHATRRTAGLLLLPYLMFRYHDFTFDDSELLFSCLFRLVFWYLLLLGLCQILVPFLRRRYENTRGRIRLLKQWWSEKRKLRCERREQRRRDLWVKNNPPPPPVPRSERMQQQIAAAQADYEAEEQMLKQAAALDEDEQYVGLLKAKQRLLQRIERIMG